MANTIYPTDVSALILIDLLNDFLSPKGKAYSRLAGQFEKVNFIPNVTRLLAGARAAGLQIVYAPHGLNQHSFDDVKSFPHEWCQPWKITFSGKENSVMNSTNHFAPGTATLWPATIDPSTHSWGPT